MFRKTTDYQATCTDCGYTLTDDEDAYEDAPLLIAAGEPLPVLIGADESEDGLWAVDEGRLRCPDCLEDPVDSDTAQEGLADALTAVTYYTFHCGTCEAPLLDGDEGFDEAWRFEAPVLTDPALGAMDYLEWDVVETTGPQPEAALVEVPGAPTRIWQATCRECLNEADLAA